MKQGPFYHYYSTFIVDQPVTIPTPGFVVISGNAKYTTVCLIFERQRQEWFVYVCHATSVGPLDSGPAPTGDILPCPSLPPDAVITFSPNTTLYTYKCAPRFSRTIPVCRSPLQFQDFV